MIDKVQDAESAMQGMIFLLPVNCHMTLRIGRCAGVPEWHGQHPIIAKCGRGTVADVTVTLA